MLVALSKAIKSKNELEKEILTLQKKLQIN
jgi:hypothetical protein